MAQVKNPKPEAFTLALHTELRAWTGRRGLSLRQLAEQSGVNRSKIQRTISSDQAALDTDEIDAICQALEISPKDLVDSAVNALKQQARKNNEPTYQEILKALKPQDGYTLAAMESERHPDMEEGVEYYE